ncbi:MAG: biotin transporter BioY [Eggerthellaceae bacterium]
MAAALTKTRTASRTRSLAFCGLSIALMTAAAWITVPFGPVPFTLQTFVMVFALLALTPKECLASIGGYLLIGAVGLPVFSAMRGGIGVLAGPTGGFLWGFLLGAAAALVFIHFTKSIAEQGGKKALAINLAAALIFMAITYLIGWVQLMFVAALSPAAAFAAAIAPFIIIDAIKIVIAVGVAAAVKKAVR